MSASDQTPAPAVAGRAGWRGVATVLLIAAAVVVLAVLSVVGGGGGNGGPALDPTSTSPAGAKALALLLSQLGTSVVPATAAPRLGSGGVALVLQDKLGAAGDRQLIAWVRAGGTLVAADMNLVFNFAPPAVAPGPEGEVVVAGTQIVDCTLAVMRGVDSIDVTDGVALRPPAGATGCFQQAGGGAFMVVEPLGRGQLVLLGSPDPWTNAELGQQDNSVLAANLLSSPPGGPPLQWIVGPRVGGGQASIWSLIAPRVKEGLLELIVAVFLLALWRARRLGRPITEVPLVELPGSELTVAVGHLLQQGGRLDDAAAILRDGVRRAVVEQLGVPTNATADAMVSVVAARTGLDPSMILAAVAGAVPASEAELVTLARQVDIIRQEMAHAH